MRCLLPEPGPIDDLAAYVAAEARPVPVDRPWILVDMIASLDGAVTVDGRSGGLAGPADKEMFRALRAIGDVILAGAGTVRAEHYGPPRPPAETRAVRQARGQSAAPRLAIVSRSLDLDVRAPMFAEADEPPYVLTCNQAPTDAMEELDEVAEVIVAGDATVDLAAALGQLRSRGVGVVTCEGGPHLNGDLLLADLIDEWALTIAPLLVGGDARRSTTGPLPPAGRPMRLTRMLEDDSVLLTRWVRDR
ncbi:MAG: pyrimidine reductase family protein [Acidimicrobiales bacterium]